MTRNRGRQHTAMPDQPGHLKKEAGRGEAPTIDFACLAAQADADLAMMARQQVVLDAQVMDGADLFAPTLARLVAAMGVVEGVTTIPQDGDLAAALDRLGETAPILAALVRRHCYEGVWLRECAQELGVGRTTAGRMLQRASRRLLALLREGTAPTT